MEIREMIFVGDDGPGWLIECSHCNKTSRHFLEDNQSSPDPENWGTISPCKSCGKMLGYRPYWEW